MLMKTVTACVVAWLVPGGGHLYLSRWKRGLLFLPTILILFIIGLHMDGQLFGWTPTFFGVLKFFAGISTGIPYFLGKMVGLGQGDIRSFGYEYGNTFLYTAGLLNMLLVVDAFDIAQGRKK